MLKKPLTCTIEYETKDGTSWKANILAYSVKEAVDLIKSRVKTFLHVNSTEGGKEIDVIHPDVRKDFFSENVVEEIEVVREVEVPVEIIKEVYVNSDDNLEIKCPWCKKVFANEERLKTHCIKYHMKN